MEKRAQFDFSWMFALLIGGAVLFLAIFAAVQFSNSAKLADDTGLARSIVTLTDPLSAGFSEASFGTIELSKETQLRNFCFDGNFGRQEISTATRTNPGDDWNELGIPNIVNNKYLFSDSTLVGEKFYVFSKPFEFPYKVSDIFFITSKNYCFKNTPQEIEEELKALSMPNIEFEESEDGCIAQESTRVCFGPSSNCDISVTGTCTGNCKSIYDEGTIRKNTVEVSYSGSLLYAGIFSDKGIYDCNVNRLLYRTKELANLYQERIDLLDLKGCDSNLRPDLLIWQSILENSTVNDLQIISDAAKSMDQKNSRELCGAW